jgi:ribose transport system permease protein
MPALRRLLRSPQVGLVLIIVALLAALSLLAGSHVDEATGKTVNNFFNSHTLIQTATDASFVAIMAVGATVVIISGGIDLSVGSVYALAGVAMGLILRGGDPSGGGAGTVPAALRSLSRWGSGLGPLGVILWSRRPPFIITLGSMWILRGIAFVTSKAESILLPG